VVGRDQVYEVTVDRPQCQYDIEKLAAGKRETWHPNGESTVSIKVKELPPSPKEKRGS